jgi:hypothetical protein
MKTYILPAFLSLSAILSIGSQASAMYDPAAGRFLSRDPVGYFAGANLYEYCDDDPLNSMDPTGEDDWKPSDCPTSCKDHYGNGLDQGVLDRLAAKLKSGGGNADVVFRDNCGGTGFSLTCPCQDKRGGEKKTEVCINKTTFNNTCDTIAALEHEFWHVHHGSDETGAYTRSCRIQAQQQCLTPDPKSPANCPERRKYDDWMKKCVADGVPKSTGDNAAAIQAGCAKLCADLGLRLWEPPPRKKGK